MSTNTGFSTNTPFRYPMIPTSLLPRYNTNYCASRLPGNAQDLLSRVASSDRVFYTQRRRRIKTRHIWNEHGVLRCYDIELLYASDNSRVVARNMIGPDIDHLMPHPDGADTILAQVDVDPAVAVLYENPSEGKSFKEIILGALNVSLDIRKPLRIKISTESDVIGLRPRVLRVIGLYKAVDGIDILLERLEITAISK
ncbi:hypothetical protein BDZ94DRAFT_1312236 [Collybia nuda]|uniref:Uncharacterized protein n=1 Tax=Collybia nuda TaxID=64659 RepID=A0A9P5XYX4_9AGAR|nr:hypothetical protein BDZ94DRAFT_1312236 [Collybia nuda]